MAQRSSRSAVRFAANTSAYFLTHALVLAVGVILTLLGGVVWPAIGTSMIATGVAGWVIFVYIARTDRTRQRLELLTDVGITDAFDKRAAQIRSQYGDRLEKARGSVDIIGFGLSDFRRDYLAELPALSARARVRILLIDPTSGYADQRDSEEGQTVGTIRNEVSEFISGYRGLAERPDYSKLEIRTYSTLPLVNIFRIDDELLWGPYLVGRASGNTTTQIVRRGGTLFEQLTLHFEEVWDHHSTRVDLAP